MLFTAFFFVVYAARECSVVPSSSSRSDRRMDKSVIRIGTFNAAWLFDGENDPEGVPWKSPNEARLHMDRVAEVIKIAQIDVLAVHEVENCIVLERLALKLGPAFSFYLVPGTDSATQQNSGLITKIDPQALFRTNDRQHFPVSGSSCGRGVRRGSTGVSKHSVARLRASTFEFDFIFAHFKAGRKNSDCAKREAQAQVLKNLAKKSVPAIFAGDFNEKDESFSDASGEPGFSQTLAILKGSTHFNAGSFLREKERNSFPIGLIDHILIPNEFRDRVVSVQCGTDLLRIPSNARDRLSQYFSDHLPVIVTILDREGAKEEWDVQDTSSFVWGVIMVVVLLGVVTSSFCNLPR